jgi:CheY-like chemotaxis protein
MQLHQPLWQGSPAMSKSEPVRVLVVDDNRDAAESLATLLGLSGYSVRVALGGQEALDEMPGFDPHCVMLDVDMPGMDGMQLAATLRQGSQASVVIIAVTGWAREDQELSKDFEHFDYCLRKPVDPKRLDQLLPPVT